MPGGERLVLSCFACCFQYVRLMDRAELRLLCADLMGEWWPTFPSPPSPWSRVFPTATCLVRTTPTAPSSSSTSSAPCPSDRWGGQGGAGKGGGGRRGQHVNLFNCDLGVLVSHSVSVTAWSCAINPLVVEGLVFLVKDVRDTREVNRAGNESVFISIRVASLKPVLNSANICFTNLVRVFHWTRKMFGEHSCFLTGWTFASSNCNEAMFGVQKSSLNMFWEYLPSSANRASDWLREKRALLWMRKK